MMIISTMIIVMMRMVMMMVMILIIMIEMITMMTIAVMIIERWSMVHVLLIKKTGRKRRVKEDEPEEGYS